MRPVVFALAFALAIPACAHEPSIDISEPTAPPRVTHSPADHPVDFSADQTVEAEVRGRSLTVRVVMEKLGDRLTLVGLTPFGARAYTLVQEGLEVDAEVHLESELSFPPSLVVTDIHRTFLVGFPAPPGTPRDGTRTFVAGGETFVDTVVGGVVGARTVTPPGPDPDALEILYSPEGMRLDGTPPRVVTVRHVRSGYELTITTTSYRRSPARRTDRSDAARSGAGCPETDCRLATRRQRGSK